MRLTEMFRMDEDKFVATLRNGQKFPVFKNPQPEELKKIGMNGIIKGILTPTNFIGFDFNNVDMRDLPPIQGYPVILYFGKGTSLTVELFPNVNIPKDKFEDMVASNLYLKNFDIQRVIWHNETE